MFDSLRLGGASLELVLGQVYVTAGVLALGLVLLEVAYLVALVVFLSRRKAGDRPEEWHGASGAKRERSSLMLPGTFTDSCEHSVRSDEPVSNTRPVTTHSRRGTTLGTNLLSAPRPDRSPSPAGLDT